MFDTPKDSVDFFPFSELTQLAPCLPSEIDLDDIFSFFGFSKKKKYPVLFTLPEGTHPGFFHIFKRRAHLFFIDKTGEAHVARSPYEIMLRIDAKFKVLQGWTPETAWSGIKIDTEGGNTFEVLRRTIVQTIHQEKKLRAMVRKDSRVQTIRLGTDEVTSQAYYQVTVLTNDPIDKMQDDNPIFRHPLVRLDPKPLTSCAAKAVKHTDTVF